MEHEPSQLAHPQRLSVASRIQSDRSPLTTEFNPDNPASFTPETPLKREGCIGGAWGKRRRCPRKDHVQQWAPVQD